MLKLAIQDFEGRTHYVPLKDGEYSIGRDDANQICLSDRNVSRQHARILAKNSQIWIENVAATYGTRFNNLLLRERTELQPGDVIEVGDYKLELVNEEKRDTALRESGDSGRDTKPMAPAAATAGQSSKGKAPDGATAIVNLADISALLNKDPSSPSQAIPEASQPRLIVESENLRGLELRITKTPVIVGRVRENADLVIDHRSISKEHARLTRLSDGTWQVLDLGSANGIKVNGEPYSKSEIRSGDRVELGHVSLRFLAAGAKAPSGSVAPAAGGKKGNGAMVLGIALAGVILIGVIVAVVMLASKKDGATPDKPKPDAPGKIDSSGKAEGDTPGKAEGDTPGKAEGDTAGKGKGADPEAAKGGDADKLAGEKAAGDKAAANKANGDKAAAVAKVASTDEMLAAIDAKLAAGRYEEALPMLEALKVQNQGNARIAAKYAEVTKLVALKRKLDQSEKFLETDATKALDLAIDVQTGAPEGSPLQDGAKSIVEVAKKILKGGKAPKAAQPKGEPKGEPKQVDPKPGKVKVDPPKVEPPKAEGKTPKELYDDAREALGASDWERAIASAKQALKQGFKKANTVLAKAYWGKGDKGNCFKYAQAAIDAGFDDASMQGLVNKCQ